MLVCPGFIDAQINGAFGVDFTSDSVDTLQSDGILKVKKALLQYGVTAFCPTVISSSSETYKRILPVLVPRKGPVQDGAEILGVHLEGPFISNVQYGAHNPTLLQSSSATFVSLAKVYGEDTLVKDGPVRMVTLAPELPGAMQDAIPELTRRNITVSIGHSDGMCLLYSSLCMNAA